MEAYSLITVPGEVFNRMFSLHRDVLLELRERCVDSSLSDAVYSTASDFLDDKIASLEDERDYMACIKGGLDDIRIFRGFSDAAFRAEVVPLIRKFRKISDTLVVIKRMRRFIEEDMQDELIARHEPTFRYLTFVLHEKFYTESLLPGVKASAAETAKSRKNPPSSGNFRKEVERYYKVETAFLDGVSWCTVLGFPITYDEVKAVHIVPEFLSQDALSHLFWNENDVRSDPRNGNSFYF